MRPWDNSVILRFCGFVLHNPTRRIRMRGVNHQPRPIATEGVGLPKQLFPLIEDRFRSWRHEPEGGDLKHAPPSHPGRVPGNPLSGTERAPSARPQLTSSRRSKPSATGSANQTE